jgi:hypothetical protein
MHNKIVKVARKEEEEDGFRVLGLQPVAPPKCSTPDDFFANEVIQCHFQ